MSQSLPPSTVDWNNLFNLAAFIAITAVAIVMGAMIFFAIKYHEKKGQQEIHTTKLVFRETEQEKL